MRTSTDTTEQSAPGWPGIAPRWTSSAKSGVGTAFGPASRVWFTLSHGILNEVYYPRVDLACVRDLGLIVTDGRDFFSEEKRHASSSTTYLAAGAPAYRLVNTCRRGRYRIVKDVLSDPHCNALLQRIEFAPLEGALADYHLYALLAPHLANQGGGNTAWLGDYKGVPMLFAERSGSALALACSAPWLNRSAGFAGFSDGWQDLSQHLRMTWSYSRAENGNVALTAEPDLQACGGKLVLALGFGRGWAQAAMNALGSLRRGFDAALSDFQQEWQSWQDSLVTPPAPTSPHKLLRTSAMTLRVHDAKTSPGGAIASLSIPWGFAKGDDDLGGYHLVWPRDLVETAGGLLAVGARDDFRRILEFLEVTQEADGHWAQNLWLDGTPLWTHVQMDETALPILLVDLGLREGALGERELARFWPMARRAAGYILRHGPVTQQDRWEEDPGYSPFTLAAEIAALLAAADLAERSGEPEDAGLLRATADAWNENVERWMYATGTELARQLGIEGYYVRVAPPEVAGVSSPHLGYVPIKNRPPGDSLAPADQILSPDALALVRFGLRAANDPRIVNTVRAIDSELMTQTPSGSAWHRYNRDAYGEHEDGSPFDGTGVGRLWPLLTGERAHYELAAGRADRAKELLLALERFANDGGMLSEQLWDAPDIPERELFFGRPSGSAMPLAWAHAEYLKLCRSLGDGRVFDVPPQPVERYLKNRTASQHAIWSYSQKIRTMPAGKTLRLVLFAPATVRWSPDNWLTTAQDIPAKVTRLGAFVADLPTTRLASSSQIVFTFKWSQEDRWEGVDFRVEVARR